MRKIIHSINFLILIVFCVVFTSCKTINKKINAGNEELVFSMSVSKEKIPIMAWHGVKEQTVARYLELKECGIDYNFTFHSNVEDLSLALDAAKAMGIKTIIYCPELISEPEKIVNRFKEHPALAGYFLNDEEPIDSDFKNLGKLARRIQAVDNEHFCYVNLFGMSSELEESIYRKYLQSCINEVSVQFLSFDIYPIQLNEGVRFLYSGWYRNLEVISDEARKSGKPFWAFALTTSHNTRWGNYPIPTIADLRLQVYSNLAYGAQGIQYFTYWTPSIIAEAMESFSEYFHDGPIYNGIKTATWHTAQEMSMEIKALSNVFFGAQVIKVEHIATNALGKEEPVPAGTTRFDFANRLAEASIIKKFNTIGETNALVSFLKNGNKCYMVIINCNLEGGDNVTFRINGGIGLKLIKKDGKAVSAAFKSSKQTITPGDVLIYGWDY